MSFDDAGVPRQGETGGDGIEVLVDACGERVEAGRAALPDGVETVRQAFILAHCERGRERADVAGEGVQFGAVGPDCLELELFDLGKGIRAAESPPGDGQG
ncbi:hypothetical protein ACFXP1_15720 [Streptomyces sp. NPDC059112]|uniref:hypothetical protein n=1 Tax=Streptomyces sp. NPDC059112 TaxID=3346730 RepID=UPI0036AFBAEC